MTAACFRGTYSDFKLIKTRGVVSISFEIPVEQAQAALDVLGGMPVAATEVWCGIARLNHAGEDSSAGTAAAPKRDLEKPPTSGRGQPAPDTQPAKQAFRDMRLVNQAGMLCDELSFQRFITERAKSALLFSDEGAAEYVREYCGVRSRSDIRPRTPSGDRWTKLHDEYRLWMHEVV
jgi:hypothetical protein